MQAPWTEFGSVLQIGKLQNYTSIVRISSEQDHSILYLWVGSRGKRLLKS